MKKTRVVVWAISLALAAPWSQAAEEKDDATALANLPGDVREGFEILFSWGNLVPALAIAGASGAVSPLDDDLQAYFGRAERFGEVGDVASHPAVLSGAFGALIVAGRLSEDERHRAMSYDLIQALLVNNAVTFAIKIAVGRERPDGGTRSFPSGHASNLFTIASIVGDHYGLRLAIPLHAFAVFISLARLDNDSHWVSDSVAGAGLGLLVGHSILRKGALPTPSSRLTWMPWFGADGAGVVFSLELGDQAS